jgi:hypothetical protein
MIQTRPCQMTEQSNRAVSTFIPRCLFCAVSFPPTSSVLESSIWSGMRVCCRTGHDYLPRTQVFSHSRTGSKNPRYGAPQIRSWPSSPRGWLGSDHVALHAYKLSRAELSGATCTFNGLPNDRVFLPLTAALLYVHRCFFAQAISSHPNDPIKSQYAPSFLAGYRSACSLIDLLKIPFSLFPAQIARFWVLWTHAFSSAVSHHPLDCTGKVWC